MNRYKLNICNFMLILRKPIFGFPMVLVLMSLMFTRLTFGINNQVQMSAMFLTGMCQRAIATPHHQNNGSE